eukprot:2254659-Alexandrium_andersonii.AAC.1
MLGAGGAFWGVRGVVAHPERGRRKPLKALKTAESAFTRCCPSAIVQVAEPKFRGSSNPEVSSYDSLGSIRSS